jgi:hypothetical protein
MSCLHDLSFRGRMWALPVFGKEIWNFFIFSMSFLLLWNVFGIFYTTQVVTEGVGFHNACFSTCDLVNAQNVFLLVNL